MKKLNFYIATIIAVLIVVSAPCFGIVSGTVSDAFKNPVSGASVTFTDESDSSRFFSAITDADGKYQVDIATSVNQEYDTDLFPGLFLLKQNYPNPFNPATLIPFTLSKAGYITLSVYNIQGQKVRTLLDGYLSAGGHSVMWNALDDRDRLVGAGVYLYQLRVGGRAVTKKMLLLDGGSAVGVLSASSGSERSDFRKTWKIAETTYLVNITGDNIEPYKESGLDIDEHRAYDFTVIRKTEWNGIRFVAIPGGTFQMGDVENTGNSNEKPVHTVTVSSFEMSVYEITNAQYAKFLNEALASGEITATSASVKGAKGVYSGQGYVYFGVYWSYKPNTRCWITYDGGIFSVAGHENWPVVWVTWYGAKAFALYYGLDLPTEAEWEYACRGGKQYKYGTNDGTISTSKAKYYVDNFVLEPVDVGRYPKNPFGLYDMSGNVLEWCHDWYGSYPSASVTNPTGDQTGSYRVGRGGSWFEYDFTCRSARRYYVDPTGRLKDLGFRVVRRVSPQNY